MKSIDDFSNTKVILELTKIWENLLGIQPIGVRDNFFELGGHSLLALRLFARIEKIFGKTLLPSTLFQAPTIEQLSRLLGQKECSAPWFSLVAIQPSGSKPPFFCVHSLDTSVLLYYDLACYLGLEQPVYGLQPKGLDGKQIPHTQIEEMAAAYITEIRTVQAEGPYFIGGFCFGGIVAFEMAQQLHAQGQKVGVLAMLDTSHPKIVLSTSARGGNTLTLRQRGSYQWAVLSGHLSNLSRLKPQEKLTYVRDKVLDKAKGRIKQKNKNIAAQDTGTSYIEQIHFQALSNYVPQVYPGHITIFRASMSPARFYDPQLGWGELAAVGLEIYDVPGHHGGSTLGAIFKPPNVQILAKQLRACLDKWSLDYGMTK